MPSTLQPPFGPDATATDPVAIQLRRLRAGDEQAHGEIWTLLYASLCRRARLLLRGDSLATAVSPADVVHEAYCKVRAQALARCRDRGHVLGLLTRAMRQVLADEAKRRRCRRRVRAWPSECLEELAAGRSTPLDDRLDIAAAFEAVRRVNETLASVLSLRHLAGLSTPEVAAKLGMGTRSVQLHCRRGNALLRAFLARGNGSGEEGRPHTPLPRRHAC